MPEEERNTYADWVENKSDFLMRWHPVFGDRLNELVFIGQHLDQKQIEGELLQCQLTDTEITQWQHGQVFQDPWPVW